MRTSSVACKLFLLGVWLTAAMPGMAQIYQEFGGVVIMEAENTPSSFGIGTDRWDVYGPSDPYYVIGATGEAHVEFQGNRPASGPPKTPLTYTFKINQGGYYRLEIRARKRLEGEPEDRCNDCYVRMGGDAFGAGPNAGDTHRDDATLELLQVDTKMFGGNAADWGWAVELDPGGHNNKRWPVYDFTAGSTYTLTVSGRSQRFNIDRIILRRTTVAAATAQDPSLPESTVDSNEPPPPTLLTDSLPDAHVDAVYSAEVVVWGGDAPFTWSIIDGSLPSGLSLSNGIISGTPTAQGTNTFTVRVTDSDGDTADKQLSLVVINIPSGPAVFSNTDAAETEDKTWTITDLNKMNPTVSTGNGIVSGAFSGAGAFGASDSITLRADGYAGWSATDAQAAVAAGTFTNYLYSLQNVGIGAILTGQFGVDSGIGDTENTRIGGAGSNVEVMVFEVDLSRLSAADQITLSEIRFHVYAAADRTDFLIYDKSAPSVIDQSWNRSYDPLDAITGSWVLEDGDLILLGTGASAAGVEKGFRVAALVFDVEASDLPSGYADWAEEYALVGGLEDDDDQDGESNIQEFYFGGNPTNGLDRSHLPKVMGAQDGTLRLVYRRREPPPNGVVYQLQQADRLTPPAWSNIASAVIGQGVLPGNSDYLQITNDVPMLNTNGFVRLLIQE